MNAKLETSAAREDLFVQLGSRRYKVERTWQNAPSDLFQGRVIDIAVDSRDRVHVCQRYDFSLYRGAAPTIHVFDADGSYVKSWENAQVQDTHHIFIDRQDRLFLVDRNGQQVMVFDLDGGLLFTIGERGRPGSPFNHPTSVAVAPSGDIYVSDGYGGTHVHRFSVDGELISTWGSPGRGPGQFTTLHGLWVASDGRVFVGDREADRVQIFSPEGDYLGELGGFYHPMSIYGDKDDNIYVSDQAPRLIAFDRDNARIGCCSPVLREGHGVSGDSRGNIYLTDMNPERVTRLAAC
ncbi:hypothetical protein [Aquamicrobium ahrensii]|uniref:Peptidylglycine monooxygenase n=1 Tax=Aquamicrobium ahrensii TaxID=469551 RepID=A0ABV2KMD2_9HYPH